MSLGNGPASFGWATRSLHWATAALVLAMLPFGVWIARTGPSFGTLWLFALHKSLGATVLALTVLRLLWHRVSPPPPPLGGVAAWEAALARVTHRGLYLLLLLVPLAGRSASSATGIVTRAWGVPLPPLGPTSEAWDRWGFRLHAALALALAGLVALHVAGALGRRDGTLRRMARGR